MVYHFSFTIWWFLEVYSVGEFSTARYSTHMCLVHCRDSWSHRVCVCVCAAVPPYRPVCVRAVVRLLSPCGCAPPCSSVPPFVLVVSCGLGSADRCVRTVRRVRTVRERCPPQFWVGNCAAVCLGCPRCVWLCHTHGFSGYIAPSCILDVPSVCSRATQTYFCGYIPPSCAWDAPGVCSPASHMVSEDISRRGPSWSSLSWPSPVCAAVPHACF